MPNAVAILGNLTNQGGKMCIKNHLGLLFRSQALFLLIIIIVSSANELYAQFTDISADPSNTGSYGWVDLDKDGDFDLYRIQSGTTRFLINIGNNVFADLVIQLMGSINQESLGDYDDYGVRVQSDVYFGGKK